MNYVAGLCSDDWGLWRSVTGNLQKVGKRVESGSYPANDKSGLLAKAASIRDAIDSKDKTLRWKLRSSVGEKVQWYLDVEE
jgi:hypothetical protein